MSRIAVLMSMVAMACGDTSDKKAEVVAGDTSSDATAVDTGDTAVTDTATTDTAVTDTAVSDGTTTDTADGASGAACTATDECVHCNLEKAPASTADCVCPSPCGQYITTTALCAAAESAWSDFCAGPKWADAHPCPLGRCLAPDPLYCHEGECADACDAVTCEPPSCRPEQQARLAGACCPRCVGEGTCASAADCTACAFDKPVTKAEDCYCVFCAATPMTGAACEANTASWQQFCEPWPKPDVCPVADCLPPVASVCSEPDGICVSDPYACSDNLDCTSCTGTAPGNPSECACPLCPHAGTVKECADIQAANDLYCADFDFSKCPLPPCAFPGEIVCDRFGTGRCGYSLRGPE